MGDGRWCPGTPGRRGGARGEPAVCSIQLVGISKNLARRQPPFSAAPRDRRSAVGVVHLGGSDRLAMIGQLNVLLQVDSRAGRTVGSRKSSKPIGKLPLPLDPHVYRHVYAKAIQFAFGLIIEDTHNPHWHKKHLAPARSCPAPKCGGMAASSKCISSWPRRRGPGSAAGPSVGGDLLLCTATGQHQSGGDRERRRRGGGGGGGGGA